jgi:hypothetical protein
MQSINNLNEWFEEFISKNYIKYYEYKSFHNIQKIGNGTTFRKVYRANLKNSEQCFALKLIDLNNTNVKEIINEVIKV